jgi:hypothetical protein
LGAGFNQLATRLTVNHADGLRYFLFAPAERYLKMQLIPNQVYHDIQEDKIG